MTGFVGTVTCVTQPVLGLATIREHSRQRDAAWEAVHAID
jgi:hypothetical protein